MGGCRLAVLLRSLPCFSVLPLSPCTICMTPLLALSCLSFPSFFCGLHCGSHCKYFFSHDSCNCRPAVLRHVLRTACAWCLLSFSTYCTTFCSAPPSSRRMQCHTIELRSIYILVNSPCCHLCISWRARCCCFSGRSACAAGWCLATLARLLGLWGFGFGPRGCLFSFERMSYLNYT